MYEVRLNEPHKQGLERLTGNNSGLFYCNERTEEENVLDESGNDSGDTNTVWVYDVYEVADAREFRKVKNAVIVDEHPFGDETKILRKTLAKILKTQNKYDDADYAEFKQYNEFCDGV